MNSLKQHGLTLIELMIVIVIIAAMAALFYPNFTNSTRKAMRSDALKSIQEVSNRLEKYMTYCNSYTNQFGGEIGSNDPNVQCSGLGMATEDTTSIPSENDAYLMTINCTSGNCMSYEIRATATSGQLKDTACQIFSISSTGAKSSSNYRSGDSTDECW